MRALARAIMRGRLQAILSVTVLALLSLLLAPLSLLSGAAVGLATLRHGSREGLLVIAGSTLASALFSQFVFGDFVPALIFTLALWLPIWALAAVLGYTRSMGMALQSGLLLTLLGLGVLYMLLEDPVQQWSNWLREPLQVLLEGSTTITDQAEYERLLASLSEWMTAVLAAAFFLQLAVTLFIARWWQALLYNPGGFGEEFREMRYDQRLAFIAAPVLIWVVVTDPPQLVAAIATLLIAGYFLLGLSVAHGLIKRLNASPGWLFGIYMLLIVAMPYAMAALAVTGYTDAWMNFRKQVAKAPPPDDDPDEN